MQLTFTLNTKTYKMKISANGDLAVTQNEAMDVVRGLRDWSTTKFGGTDTFGTDDHEFSREWNDDHVPEEFVCIVDEETAKVIHTDDLCPDRLYFYSQIILARAMEWQTMIWADEREHVLKVAYPDK